MAEAVERAVRLGGRDVDGAIEKRRHGAREPAREPVLGEVDLHAPVAERAVAAQRERAVVELGARGRQWLPRADVHLPLAVQAAQVELADAARRVQATSDDQRDLAGRAQCVEVEALRPARQAWRDGRQHVGRLVHRVVVPGHEHILVRVRRRLAAERVARCRRAHEAGPSEGWRRRRSNAGSSREGVAAGRSLLTLSGKRGGRFSRNDRAPSSASADGPRCAM